MDNTVRKHLSVPSFRWDIIESYFNDMSAEGFRFVSKTKTNYYFEKDADDGTRYSVYAYSSAKEAQAVKEACQGTGLTLVLDDFKEKLLIYYGIGKTAVLPEQLNKKQERLRKKRKTKTIFLQTVILAIYGLFVFYYCSGLGEYTYNLLEARLHHSETVFIIVCVTIMALLTLFRLLTFFPVVFKKPTVFLNDWRSVKKALSVLTVLFLLSSQIGIGILQGKNSGDTRDGIPNGLQYVAMDQFFSEDESDSINDNARTNLGKTDLVVTENYEVYLNFNGCSIDSRCVKILDDTILSDYYHYEKNKFADTEAAVGQYSLDAGQKELLNANDGFYRNDTNANVVEVVFLKGDRVIRVELRGIEADLDAMLMKIGDSFQ